MISPAVVEVIKRLLDEGRMSHRKIARLVGVSRGSVGAIANGTHRPMQAEERPRDDELEPSSGPPQRCPTCGGLVYMPCRLCHTRVLVARRAVRRLPRRPIGLIGLDLREEHAQRYREVAVEHRRRLLLEAGGLPTEEGEHG